MKDQRIASAILRLKKRANIDKTRHLLDYFDKEPDRARFLSIPAPHIYADLSKNLISSESFEELLKLDIELGLDHEIEAMFLGKSVNGSEKKPALHTLLRGEQKLLDPSLAEKQRLCQKGFEKMEGVVNALRKKTLKSAMGEAFTDVVNIGIGGSHLGPKLVVDALRDEHSGLVQVHFLANADSCEIRRILEPLSPKTTLFIVASKSFTTTETLLNYRKAKEWLAAAGVENKDLGKHFVAVTENIEAAQSSGIHRAAILPIWSWIGGRFSVWSCVGLPVALAVGMDTFYEFLEGAQDMDEHFRNSPTPTNLPKILALISFWNNNCLNSESYVVVPYSDKLRFLPSFLQQLEMESNGKSVTKNDQLTDYHTASVTWGGIGTAAQHAFFQLLHQGTRFIPVEFIVPLHAGSPDNLLDKNRIANCFAQSETLMLGDPDSNPSRFLRGNKPSNTLLIYNLKPKAIGALLSLYEHKTIVQGILWDLNSFDQWGVENGKKAARVILDDFSRKNSAGHDSSTSALIKKYIEYLDCNESK